MVMEEVGVQAEEIDSGQVIVKVVEDWVKDCLFFLTGYQGNYLTNLATMSRSPEELITFIVGGIAIGGGHAHTPTYRFGGFPCVCLDSHLGPDQGNERFGLDVQGLMHRERFLKEIEQCYCGCEANI